MPQIGDKIWVRVAPSSDPSLVGKEILRKPGSKWGAGRYFTATPEEVVYTSEIARLLLNVDLVQVDAPKE